MEKGSEKRRTDHPIDKIFVDRWSPRAMSGEAIAENDLMVLFEAARWAPSSYNNQPWRLLYARRGSEHWLPRTVDNRVSKAIVSLWPGGGWNDDVHAHFTQCNIRDRRSIGGCHDCS
jgi:uncharacterized membrane protein